MSQPNTYEAYNNMLKRLVSFTQKRSGSAKQISCEFCMKIISRSTYIKCAECVDINICIGCYAQGKEKEGHSRTHSYQVIDPLKFPLYISSWTARQELLLLEGLVRFGYGNWTQIKEHIGDNLTERQLEAHYKKLYGGGKLPGEILTTQEDGCIVTRPKESLVEYMDIDQKQDNQPAGKRPAIKKHPLLEFAGYMPQRGDFEIEYENDIEMYLADLDFYDDDRPEDTQIKLRQLDVYNKILDEREARKSFAINRWENELQNETNFKGNAIQRNIYQAMKPYARFLSVENHAKLCEGLVEEYVLRIKLEELREARNQGIRTEQEFIDFLQVRKSQSSKVREVLPIISDQFLYKQAERYGQQIMEQPDIVQNDAMLIDEPFTNTPQNETAFTPEETEFYQRLGLSCEDYQALKDSIAEQEDAIRIIDERLPNIQSGNKQELFDFLVKPETIINEFQQNMGCTFGSIHNMRVQIQRKLEDKGQDQDGAQDHVSDNGECKIRLQPRNFNRERFERLKKQQSNNRLPSASNWSFCSQDKQKSPLRHITEERIVDQQLIMQ